uniref:Uncharacterized protein n=1 Tax=Rhizophora mucronata TaxID=61149 RepID=A0A2P2QF55_RHIMU
MRRIEKSDHQVLASEGRAELTDYVWEENIVSKINHPK